MAIAVAAASLIEVVVEVVVVVVVEVGVCSVIFWEWDRVFWIWRRVLVISLMLLAARWAACNLEIYTISPYTYLQISRAAIL